MTGTSTTPRAPYKLFDYYTFADRDLFFGREEEVLRTVGEVLSTRLLVLFAPSGSGKSSLINAGVRPKLEERGFATVTVRLDCAPDLAIKRRLRERFPQAFASLSDEADLLTGLRAVYMPQDGQPAPKPLVLFLDQFEEFFIVFRDQPDVRRAFIRQVAQIKFDTNLPVYLVLSLRDDYFVNLNEFRDEIPSIFHNNANIQLRPLNDDAALRAIVEPVKKVGLKFEDGLPEQIIRDLKALQAGTASGRGVHTVSTPGSDDAASADRKPENTAAGSGLKAAPPDTSPAAAGGVLPITLQIVCHNLWLHRPGDGQPITRKLYGGKEGLGGAEAIIRNQLEESLRQIPRARFGFMRKLFQVLMTVDQTKRLRSVEDLAEILHVRDRTKLQALLQDLTQASVLRVEYSEKQLWYEFRHDYLVGEIAIWLERFKARRRRRRLAYAWGSGVLPVIALAGFALWNFLSVEVRFTPVQYDGQQEELYLTRRFNPFGFQVTTGFRKDEVTELQARNDVAGGYPLRFARPKDWLPMTNLLTGFNAARLAFIVGAQPGSYSRLVAAIAGKADVEAAAFFVQKDSSLLSPLMDCLHSTNPDERLRAVVVLGQLGKGDAAVVEGLLALLKDSDSDTRQRAAEVLGELGQNSTDWTDEHLVELLQDNLSGWRQMAGLVLADRQTLNPHTYEKVMALRNDPRPWVRMAAWDALLQIEKVREARERDAKQAGPQEPAK